MDLHTGSFWPYQGSAGTCARGVFKWFVKPELPSQQTPARATSMAD